MNTKDMRRAIEGLRGRECQCLQKRRCVCGFVRDACRVEDMIADHFLALLEVVYAANELVRTCGGISDATKDLEKALERLESI